MKTKLAVYVLAGTGMLWAAEKPRVFITESQALQLSGNVAVTANRDKADYLVRFDHEGASPTTLFVGGNKVAVFDKNEDLVYSASTRLLGNAVKGACAAITSRSGK